MPPELWSFYALMLKSRLFEEAIAKLWHDGWSITTQSEKVTGGNLNERARGLGIPAIEVDGCDVSEVWEA